MRHARPPGTAILGFRTARDVNTLKLTGGRPSRRAPAMVLILGNQPCYRRILKLLSERSKMLEFEIERIFTL